MTEERLALISQWFDSWDEYYRIKCLDLLLAKCSVNLLQYVKYETSKKLRFAPPTQVVDSRQDFTRSLPRHLCLKILSYLDPRSLCRCAQVCWYWKYLSESDELWQTKCNKLHWTIDKTMTNFEPNPWKNCYQLNLSKIRQSSAATEQEEPIIKTPPDTVVDNINDKIDKTGIVDDEDETKTIKIKKILKKTDPRTIIRNTERNRKPRKKEGPTVPPWRPSAGKPEDTHFEKFNKILKKKREDQKRSRSATGAGPRSKLSGPPSHLSSSQTNFMEYSEWTQTNNKEGDTRRSTSNVQQHRRQSKTKPVEAFDDQETTIVEEVNERNNTKNQQYFYETTDTLSPLQQNDNHIPWNYTEMHSDEEEEYD